jgi:hypothetical protein
MNNSLKKIDFFNWCLWENLVLLYDGAVKPEIPQTKAFLSYKAD